MSWKHRAAPFLFLVYLLLLPLIVLANSYNAIMFWWGKRQGLAALRRHGIVGPPK